MRMIDWEIRRAAYKYGLTEEELVYELKRFGGCRYAVALKRKTKTDVYEDRGDMVVKLHDTEIVRWNDRIITLDAGGWKTNMTKNRMNQASYDFNLGFDVFQMKKKWYVDYKGETFTFDEDSIVLKR